MDKIVTVCYGKEDSWESRIAAEHFFLQAIIASDGSERERYVNIYIKLKMGMTYCTDEEFYKLGNILYTVFN